MERFTDYAKDIMHGGLFTDILLSLKGKKDHIENVESIPNALDEKQRIAGLNFLFSEATSGMRAGDYLNSYKSLVTEFVESITDMRAFQKLDRINDPQLLYNLTTWVDGSDDWRTANRGWIYLNLRLGNFAHIKSTLTGVLTRQGNEFVDETVFGNITQAGQERKKDAAFVRRVCLALYTLYSFKKDVCC